MANNKFASPASVETRNGARLEAASNACSEPVSRIAGKAWEENHCEELTLSLAGPVSRLSEADRKTIMETRSQKEILNIMESTGFILKKESN